MKTGKYIGGILLLSFISFVCINPNNGSSSGWMFALWLGASLVITVLLGRKIVPHWIRKKGTVKGILIGGLLVLVLIPLVLTGTCAVNAGGSALSGFFHH